MDCSVAQCLEVVGEWWSMLIVRDAFLGVTRFEDFQRRLGISRNILQQRLDPAGRRRGARPGALLGAPASPRLPPDRQGPRPVARAHGHAPVGRPLRERARPPCRCRTRRADRRRRRCTCAVRAAFRSGPATWSPSPGRGTAATYCAARRRCPDGTGPRRSDQIRARRRCAVRRPTARPWPGLRTGRSRRYGAGVQQPRPLGVEGHRELVRAWIDPELVIRAPLRGHGAGTPPRPAPGPPLKHGGTASAPCRRSRCCDTTRTRFRPCTHCAPPTCQTTGSQVAVG